MTGRNLSERLADCFENTYSGATDGWFTQERGQPDAVAGIRALVDELSEKICTLQGGRPNLSW
jgi:hypothetical protein